MESSWRNRAHQAIALATLLTLAVPAACKTVYVSTTGNDANTGLTATKAKKTIQAAVNITVDGDIVKLANGIYSGVGNREVSLGGKAITVTSGGNALNCTVNAGGLRGFILSTPAGPANPTINAITFTNFSIGLDLHIAFPSITKCRFLAPGITGISDSEGHAKIDACTFTGMTNFGVNTALAETEISHGVFSQNSTGVRINSSAGSINITDSSFTGNSMGVRASDCGGVIERCTFLQNDTGFDFESAGDFVVRSTTFQENVHDAIYLSDTNVTASNCTFLRNGGFGAEVDTILGNPTSFRSNACAFLGNHLAAIYLSGANSTTAGLVDSIFVGNAYRSSGWAIYARWQAYVRMTNCTMTENYGGFTYIPDGNPKPPVITNCILWRNVIDLAGGAATYSDVGVGNTAGVGNISVDPMLTTKPISGVDALWGTADDKYGNLLITAKSPCFNKGSNVAPLMPATDYLGLKRIVNAKVDMGAYERQPSISSLSPNSAQVGQAFGMFVTINGALFESGAQAYFNGSQRITTWFSPTKMTVLLPASDFATLGSYPVKVVNPGGDYTKNSTFKVVP